MNCFKEANAEFKKEKLKEQQHNQILKGEVIYFCMDLYNKDEDLKKMVQNLGGTLCLSVGNCTCMVTGQSQANKVEIALAKYN